MTSQVSLPLWLLLIVGALALWSVIDRLLVPGVRYLMRRRFNRAIDELNTRLKLRIQPFKLAKRQALIDQLIFDPEVLRAIEDYAAANKVSREAAQARAHRYAKEIVPSFSAYAYFGIGTRLARRISTFLYRVRLGYMDEAAMQTVDPDAAVIFVINHRSNMDYVLVTYMASTSSALSYAVGEWARVWLLQNLIRSMGAYFVRRDSREPLYRKVLSRYVHLAVAGGLTQAMFPEGGLTRDGKLRPPKFGLLNYMVSSFDPKGPRDAVFVPVGINYDRVIEDRVQVAALMTPEGEKPRFKFSPKVLAGYLVHNVALRLRGKLYRYGYACVSFGKPVSLRQYVTERGIDFRTLDESRRFAEIERLGPDADAQGRRGGAGASGVAGGDRRAGGRQAALRAGAEGARRRPDAAADARRRAYPYSARRPGLCGRGRPAHAAAAPLGRGGERALSRQSGEEILLRYYANSIAHLLPDAAAPTVAAA